MKKLFSLLFLFFFSCNYTLAAMSDVLYQTSSNKQVLTEQVKTFLEQNQYNPTPISSPDGKIGFYINNPKNPAVYEVILISPKDNGCCLYGFNNKEQLSFEESLTKNLKNSNIKLAKFNNTKLRSELKDAALVAKQQLDESTVHAPQSHNYDFSDEAQQKYDAQRQQPVIVTKTPAPIGPAPKSKKTYVPTPTKPHIQPISTYVAPSNKQALKGGVVCIPSGITLGASLQSTVDSASLEKDDKITASLESDFIYHGLLIAPAGSILYGKASQVLHPGCAYGNGSMDLNFYQILTPKGTKIDISSNKITLTAAESKRAKNISKTVLTGVGMGVLGGLISYAMTGSPSAVWKGAAVGAAGGTVMAAAHKGENVKLEPGTPLKINLNKPVNISPYQ